MSTDDDGSTCTLLPQLSRDCKVEVQRILHQRALDVKLDPELQKRCIVDLGKWCSEKPDAGQVRPPTLINLSCRPPAHCSATHDSTKSIQDKYPPPLLNKDLEPWFTF